MDFFVYILKCVDSLFYIGHTDSLEKRISEHQQGLYPGFTSKRLPVELVFIQQFASRDEALAAERQMKKWTRKKKEAIIEGNWKRLQVLSKKKFKK